MESREKKPDRRVLKTKKAIRRAVIELLNQKEIDEITIKDIADRADINRKTFYNYYNSVYQVVEEIENEIVAACENALKDTEYGRNAQNVYLMFRQMEEAANNGNFYSVIKRKKGSNSLIEKIKPIIKEKAKEFLESEWGYDSEKADMLADYTVSGSMAVYQSRFDSDRRISMEEMSKGIWMMTNGCVEAMSGEKETKKEGQL